MTENDLIIQDLITYGLLAASAYNYCPNCGAKMDEEGIK